MRCTWLWWTRGGELAALRTDLSAAYSELEALRAEHHGRIGAGAASAEADGDGGDPPLRMMRGHPFGEGLGDAREAQYRRGHQ